MKFKRQSDGRYTVHHTNEPTEFYQWEQSTTFGKGAIEGYPDNTLCHWDASRRFVRITAANGEALYRIVGEETQRHDNGKGWISVAHVYRAELVEGTITEFKAAPPVASEHIDSSEPPHAEPARPVDHEDEHK